MPRFGETLFSGSPLIKWSLTPFVLVFLLAMPFLIPDLNAIKLLILAFVELACLALLAGFWLPLPYGRWSLRLLAGLVVVVELAYFAEQVVELVRSDAPFDVMFRKGSSPLRALAGLSAIGLPCLWYAIFGRFARDEGSP